MAKRSYREKKRDMELAALIISNSDTDKLVGAQGFITDLLEYRTTKKLESTYINGIRKAVEYNKEHKIYCSYNFDGTVTGRLSCSGQKVGNGKPKGVSFHTLPRSLKYNIRSCVVAPKGFVFFTVDYAAMELRVLCHVARELKMRKAFVSKDDLHWYTAELIHNRSREGMRKEVERQEAKETSFLIVYGGTEATLANKINKPVEVAKEIMGSWMRAYDAVPKYMNHVFDFIKENQYAYSLFGRKRHLKNVTSPDPSVSKKALRQGLNFTIQSVASDILLCALLGIDREFKHRRMESRLVQTVHDSVELLVHESEFDEAVSIIRHYMLKNPIMTNRFGIKLDVPLDIEFICGKSFGDGVSYEDGKSPNKEEVLEYLQTLC